ncbi:MAG: YncE family protein [Bacteroidales bacterium]|nr:YncE family protein [Bacteroidales bacterium]
MRKVLLYIVFLFVFMHSCMHDDVKLNTYNTGSGVFVVCSGNFMYGNSSLSFYHPSTGDVNNEVFFNANGFPLGDVAQSLILTDSLGYIVVNNSGRIYAFDPNSFIAKGKIIGLTSPRYIHLLNAEKAYVSDLYAKKIWVVNPINLSVIGSIDVDNHNNEFYQHSTEQMVQYGKKVFVACWSFDNKLLVIDTENDRLCDSITVGLQPAKMLIDRYHQIWVYCDGGSEGAPFGHESPSLYRVNSETLEAVKVFEFDTGVFGAAMCMNANGDTLFFTACDVYAIDVLSPTMPEQPFVEAGARNITAIACDAATGDFYMADAVDWMQQGIVYRYSRNAHPLDTFRVGINPVEIVFK